MAPLSEEGFPSIVICPQFNADITYSTQKGLPATSTNTTVHDFTKKAKLTI